MAGERRRPAGSAGRRQPSRNARRPAPAGPPPKGGPSVGVILLIGLPALGIVAVLAIKMLGTDEPPPQVHDDNQAMNRLLGQVNELEREGHEVLVLLRGDLTDRVRARAEAFRERAGNWMDEFEILTRDLRDDKGRLKEEYQGYSEDRSRINQVLLEFNKSSPF